MTFRPLIALAPLALIAACAANGPAVTGGAEPGTDAVIDMQPVLRFSPSPTTISVGDTVEFRNVSAFKHTVSTRPADESEAKATQLPNGAESFDSGEVPGGGIYRHTFTVPGTYKYFCEPHHGVGMVGTIIVTAS
jgi:plastocyanin